MNRRLHHLPFRPLQDYTSYKAPFEGIPTAWINPEYTSQRCLMSGHTERVKATRSGSSVGTVGIKTPVTVVQC